MISNDELPHHANRILDALSSGPMLWLRDIPNRGTRRRALYERFPGIRSTGVYLIRDVQGPPGLFYVGKVIQDPEDPDTVN